MKSDYSLTITPEIMGVCTSKYEAVLLSAISAESCIDGATFANLSKRTQGLVLPHEMPKYLNMLLKKGFIAIALSGYTTDSDNKEWYQVNREGLEDIVLGEALTIGNGLVMHQVDRHICLNREVVDAVIKGKTTKAAIDAEIAALKAKRREVV